MNNNNVLSRQEIKAWKKIKLKTIKIKNIYMKSNEIKSKNKTFQSSLCETFKSPQAPMAFSELYVAINLCRFNANFAQGINKMNIMKK